MPNASRDASRWIRKRLYLAAIAERGDGQFLDQIGDGHRFADPVRAAIAGAAERAAAPAGIPGNKTARRDQQQLDGMLACRGQAGAQAGHGPPVRRLPQELGCCALVLQVPPVPDDAVGEGTDLRRGQRVRVSDEQPANWSRNPAGRTPRTCGIVSWWPPMMTGSAPLAWTARSSSAAVSW